MKDRLARVSDFEDLDIVRSAGSDKHHRGVQRVEGDLLGTFRPTGMTGVKTDLSNSTAQNTFNMLHRSRAAIFGVQADVTGERSRRIQTRVVRREGQGGYYA